MRINFILPPIPKISGGPLAILEYANRLIDRGHHVTITTYPDLYWEGDNPFPWFEFKGEIRYTKLRDTYKVGGRKVKLALRLIKFFARILLSRGRERRQTLRTAAMIYLGHGAVKQTSWVGEKLDVGFRDFSANLNQMALTTEAIPDCDINIATWWMTAFPALWSGKGKPVYFIQHYEEVFYGHQYTDLVNKLMCRMTYALPLFKVGNSSWLANVVKEKFGEIIPWSSNGIDLKDFRRAEKPSDKDGIIRIVTYSRPEEWKGLGDAAVVISEVKKRTQVPIEWHLFGYRNPNVPPDNADCPYIYHEKLSFEALSNLYATSDINLFCSWYESFPLPPLEAMASGTAVVTTSLGTEEYAFHDETALVFEPRQIEKAVESVLRLIEDRELRQQLVERGYLMAQKFGWDQAVSNREKILMEIHQGKSHQGRFNASEPGFIDGNGVRFSQMPSDLSRLEGKIIFLEGTPHMYLVQRGSKRAIQSMEVFQQLAQQFGDPVAVSSIDYFRIPSGYAVLEMNQL